MIEMREMDADAMLLVRGGAAEGGYQDMMPTEPGEGGGGGGYDVGGGIITDYAMDNLQQEVANGTDASVTSLAENMYTSDVFGPGGQYYVPAPGSPPPSFRDIYNSIPGVPKDKVRKISHGFKIC